MMSPSLEEGMRNWAGTHTYRARRVLEPTSVEEVAEIVGGGRRVRALGTRHSFNDLADTTGDLVSLARLHRPIVIDAETRTLTVGGGHRYGDECGPLDEAGFALANLASLPHISIAGACATATHGSGVRNRTLATSVSGLEIVRADGEVVRITRADQPEILAGAIVSLGALGIVTALELDIEPAYEVAQEVYEGLSLERLRGEFDAIVGAAYSVSLFTDWTGPSFHQLWVKTRLDPATPAARPAERFGARRAEGPLHPIPGFSSAACTEQGSRRGAWHERLPHFRLDHTPSAGAELQSEYLVDRTHGVDALEGLMGLRRRLAPLVQVTEVRTVAADELWLSPAYRRPSVAIHFTWVPDGEAVSAVLPEVESVLEPFEPRPHWGKLFALDPAVVQARYPRRSAFVDLSRRLDPEGKFRNDFLDRFVLGAPG
jgi:alditol oxidase